MHYHNDNKGYQLALECIVQKAYRDSSKSRISYRLANTDSEYSLLVSELVSEYVQHFYSIINLRSIVIIINHHICEHLFMFSVPSENEYRQMQKCIATLYLYELS